MKRTLKNEIVLNDDSKIVKILMSPSFKIIGLGFKKFQLLEKHKTPTKAVLVVQFGEVEFCINGSTQVISAGDFFEIPENIEHEIKALAESYLYLIK
jgi:quercetin dioxygenase-like cupin family protein